MKDPDFKGFADEILFKNEIDGFEIQDFAEKHGLIEMVIATESCGDGCKCAGVTDFPAECYRKTY